MSGKQNISSAVMAQRREPPHALDDFPTPPWATRALCERLALEHDLRCHRVREPAANRGHMVQALSEYFREVEATDVFDYGAGFGVADYLWGAPPAPVDWTITNPPFRLALPFALRAIETSRVGVALFVRTAFLEGAGRYRDLFSYRPPALILQFSERVVLHKGRLAPDGSTATAYCWIVWLAGFRDGAAFDWIEPCRRRLERPGDYPAEAASAGSLL